MWERKARVVSTLVVITYLGRSSRAGNVQTVITCMSRDPQTNSRELGVRVIQPIPKMRGVGCLYMQSRLEVLK
jgi:hypothetical protein